MSGTRVERKELSIREFSELCGISHTEMSRKMAALGIIGNPQGRGKPTLLSPADQDALSQALFTPAVKPSEVHTEPSGGVQVYVPQPLFLRGSDGSADRLRGEMVLGGAVGQWMSNQNAFHAALLASSQERGAQLGAQMFATEMGAAMSTYQGMQATAGNGLGVLEDSPD